jgi:hypothetical protein
MIVEIAIPELTQYPNGFPSHWMNIIFLGNRPDDYKSHAIITTYVRLVEGAYVHYRNARQLVQAVWNNHGAIAIGSHNLSSIYFEDCINSMHRAVLCMKGIRHNREVPEGLRSMFPDTPHFTKDAIANRIRGIRDVIQHMDARVLKGQIPEGTTFMLTATGPETPVPESNQPNQTLKRIDRLAIGDAEVLFTELVAWLREMGKCAESISKYKRS